jgi:CRISPR-associated protein Cmr1
MKKLEYRVSFTTPAFLGNAEQQAQWRTPPFKALIRQWWRVVHAPKADYDVARLRRDEAALFGSASDDKGMVSGKSLVRLRLNGWDPGAMKEWQACGTVHHPEVGQNGQNVGADLYLGYGPLGYERGKGTVLGTVRDTGVKRTAIEPVTTSATLQIIYPGEREDELKRTMQLIAWFGTLGSRSRNGWGSLAIEGIRLLSREALNGAVRPFNECLKLEWAHGIGSDSKAPLVWTARPDSDWRNAIQALAKAKIGFRTNLKLKHGETPHQTKPTDISFEDRHLLAYPLTHHAVAGWSEESAPGRLKYDCQGWVVQSARLANQLRFKVAEDAQGRFVACIVHLPCALPQVLAQALGRNAPTVQQQTDIWRRVHAWLDNTTQSGFQRI